MQLPATPIATDNLYKFTALGSLAALIFILWFSITMMLQMKREIGTLETDVELYECEMRYLEADANRLETNVNHMFFAVSNMDAFVSSAASNYISMEVVGALRNRNRTNESSLSALLQEGEKQKATLKELAMKKIQLQGKTKLLRDRVSDLKILRWCLPVTSFLLLGCMVRGFHLWKIRVQDLQDRILVNEADERTNKKTKTKLLL